MLTGFVAGVVFGAVIVAGIKLYDVMLDIVCGDDDAERGK